MHVGRGMSEGPWIRFFPSDWLAGTRGMSAAETGIYITLIAMMYERGEPLADDKSRLARLCGTTPSALKSTLDALVSDGKIEVVDGGLWNEKVGAETEYRREKSGQARESAEKRWQKRKKKQQQPHANAMQTHCDGNANQNQISEDASQAQHLDADYGRAKLDKIEAGLRQAANLGNDPSPGLLVLAPILGLLRSGHDWDLDVIPTVRAVAAKARRPIRSWEYFVNAIIEASALRRAHEARGLAPPAEIGPSGTIFDQIAKQVRDGQTGNSGGDGIVIDALPSLPGIKRQDQPGNSESLPDSDRGGEHRRRSGGSP